MDGDGFDAEDGLDLGDVVRRRELAVDAGRAHDVREAVALDLGGTRGLRRDFSTLECLNDHIGVTKNASTLRETLRRDDHRGDPN